MKKSDLSKLPFKTTTIRLLNQEQLTGIAGGEARSGDTNCSMSCSLTYRTSCFETTGLCAATSAQTYCE
jgi:hypothetical protein